MTILNYYDIINYYNQTSVTEAVSGEINMALGVIMLFIGIVFLYSAFSYYKKNNRNLKNMR